MRPGLRPWRSRYESWASRWRVDRRRHILPLTAPSSCKQFQDSSRSSRWVCDSEDRCLSCRKTPPWPLHCICCQQLDTCGLYPILTLNNPWKLQERSWLWGQERTNSPFWRQQMQVLLCLSTMIPSWIALSEGYMRQYNSRVWWSVLQPRPQILRLPMTGQRMTGNRPKRSRILSRVFSLIAKIWN